jgi:hypothetical protein
MPETPTNVATREFNYRPVKMTLWMLLFLGLATGMFFMAYLSLNPSFYGVRTSGRYLWIDAFMNDLPLWARVGIWAVLGMICAFGSYIFGQRWLSGLPPLVLSAQGVTGFKKGIGLARLTIPWGEITKMQELQSNAFIYGTVIDSGGVRKPKPPHVVVHLGMIGRNFETLLSEITDYNKKLGNPAA